MRERGEERCSKAESEHPAYNLGGLVGGTLHVGLQRQRAVSQNAKVNNDKNEKKYREIMGYSVTDTMTSEATNTAESGPSETDYNRS